MTPEVRIRYLEIQENIQKAREIISEARENNDLELRLVGESKLDFNYGAMSELKRWFGDFEQSK